MRSFLEWLTDWAYEGIEDRPDPGLDAYHAVLDMGWSPKPTAARLWAATSPYDAVLEVLSLRTSTYDKQLSWVLGDAIADEIADRVELRHEQDMADVAAAARTESRIIPLAGIVGDDDDGRVIVAGSDTSPPPTGVVNGVCVPCQQHVGHVWHDNGMANRSVTAVVPPQPEWGDDDDSV